jgi:hypothetical protein
MKFENLRGYINSRPHLSNKVKWMSSPFSPGHAHFFFCFPLPVVVTVVPGDTQGPHSGPLSKASRYAFVALSWSQKL